MAGRIEIDCEVMQGKPVVRNTRIPRRLSRLTVDDIRACLAYAADTIAHETVLGVGTH